MQNIVCLVKKCILEKEMKNEIPLENVFKVMTK
jgi:hypothetical protein